ncbi:MAG: DUF4177 domain-containing protein [Desulfobulbaceae bacterium]|nr:MAG: DUF4177 domain-containing protein [Desulfobulbaceae bacterium]
MRWSYKTVHFELKKEGLLGSAFLDESEMELELNEFGKTGWELVSVLEVHDGMIAFFKQPLGGGEQQVHKPGPTEASETHVVEQNRQPTMTSPPTEPVRVRTESATPTKPGIGAIKIE